MRICYCADKNVIHLLNMSAESVLKFNPDAEIIVISKEKLNIKYRNLILKTDGYSFKRKSTDRVTETTYYRLFIPTFGFDKCIYLDCDTLCCGSLKELWDTDVPYIGVCHSHNSGISQAKKIGIKKYASAGMMLMNCENLRKIFFTQVIMRTLKYIRTPFNFYHDETMLNILYSDLMTFLPIKWIKCKNRKYNAYNDEVKFKDSIIHHYIGGQKKQQYDDYNLMIGFSK